MTTPNDDDREVENVIRGLLLSSGGRGFSTSTVREIIANHRIAAEKRERERIAAWLRKKAAAMGDLRCRYVIGDLTDELESEG